MVILVSFVRMYIIIILYSCFLINYLVGYHFAVISSDSPAIPQTESMHTNCMDY